jgi:hypothetical protein
MRLDHLQRIPKRAQAWKDWVLKRRCAWIPLLTPSPAASFSLSTPFFSPTNRARAGKKEGIRLGRPVLICKSDFDDEWSGINHLHVED